MLDMPQNQIFLVIDGEEPLGRAIVEALFYQGDITKSSDVEQALNADERTVTIVLHMVSHVIKAPEALPAKVNIEVTRALLAACRLAGVERFVYTSSASVIYSGPELEYVDESIEYSTGLTDYYLQTKATAEKMVLGYDYTLRMRTTALRLPVVIGTGD
ncbi:erg26, C-3 sterol dehydrogenase [Coemansia erecta]|uniref:Erg26, C-3 sterol dehydrogenase n=1 Tax=Coemansia erecta TaxID=147472 RepID=A0A9W7XWD3_9FUNG|nr:erg26, C-3 sterol dehydrogenase [Coemansia erecta]